MSSPNIIPLICYQQKLFLRALLILKVKLLLLPITKKTTFFKKEKEAYQEIDGLDDIQEHLILPVLDALGAPGHCVGDSGRGPRGPRLQLVAFLSDVPVGPGWVRWLRHRHFWKQTLPVAGARRGRLWFHLASFNTAASPFPKLQQTSSHNELSVLSLRAARQCWWGKQAAGMKCFPAGHAETNLPGRGSWWPRFHLLLCQEDVCHLTPWTAAHQAPLSIPRQEHWSGLPCPPPEDLPNPGIKPTSPALAGGFFTTEPPGKPACFHLGGNRYGVCWRYTASLSVPLLPCKTGTQHLWLTEMEKCAHKRPASQEALNQ